MAFADPVTLFITHIETVTSPTPVHGRVPKQRPDEFHQVRRQAGPALPPVRELVRLDVWTWALTDLRATELHSTLRSAVWALSGTNTLGVMVYEIAEFKGPGSADDAESGHARVWATYDLTIRADDVIEPAPSLSP